MTEKPILTSINNELEICKKLDWAYQKGATDEELVELYRQLRNPNLAVSKNLTLKENKTVIRRITGHEPDIEWG